MKKHLLFAVLFTSTLTTTLPTLANDDFSVSADLAAAMKRDLGITESELSQYARAEKLASSLEWNAQAQFGDDYAGSWMKRVSEGVYDYVVATRGNPHQVLSTQFTSTMAVAGAELIQVDFSLDELNASMSILDDAMSDITGANVTTAESDMAPIDGIHSWYVDVQTNSIVMSVDLQSKAQAMKYLASVDINLDMIRFEASTGEPSTMIDIYGGQAWSGCSVGFSVTRGSTQGFVTAGHCGRRGASVTINGTRVGSLQGSSYPGDDMAWGNVRSSDTLQPFVSRYNGGSVLDVRVNGTQVAAIGASVCRSGRTTGYRCGQIVSRNASVNYGSGRVSGLTQSTACAGRGDSGGAWISGNGQAQGVTSGGQLPRGRNDNCSVGTPVSWFQPVREILSTYGLSITR